MSVFDFVEQGSAGAGFIYKSETAAYAYIESGFIATVGSGTSVMNISSVSYGSVIIGMTISGGTLQGTATIVSFGTFNGTSGTVNLSSVQTFTNPTTVVCRAFVKITSANYPTVTVKGIVYLDGTYYVMTPSGSIYGSNLEDPFTWSALNVIQARSEPDGGVALVRVVNLIIAFGEYSTEFFYDAGNPVGSPLSPYQSAMLELGCASSGSIATAENTIYYMGKARQKGRSIYKLEGTTPTLVSTPFIDRILNADTLLNCVSYFIKIAGHGFYLLTLPNTGITLVYDTVTQMWSSWTQPYLFSTLTSSTFSWANGIVTVTKAGHGLADGDYITITGSTPSSYNGSYVTSYVSSSVFTFPLASDPGTYVSGASIAVYKETFFNMSSYTKSGNLDLVQDSTTGSVYAMDTGTFQDNGLPIKYRIRTSKIDGGSNDSKFVTKMELIGDKLPATAYVRYSNDDYQTWSAYQPVNLAAQRSQLYRQGKTRRRAYEVINYDNQPIRLESIELTMSKGNN